MLGRLDLGSTFRAFSYWSILSQNKILVRELDFIKECVSCKVFIRTHSPAVHANGQILCHEAFLHRLYHGGLHVKGELREYRVVVELSSMLQSTRPCENAGDRIGTGRLAFLVLAPMSRDSAVCCLGLHRLTVGCDQHRGHKAQ